MIEKAVSVSNDRMAVEVGGNLQIRDINVYKHREQGKKSSPFSQMGMWINNQFIWLHSPEWRVKTQLHSHSDVLYSEAIHEELLLRVTLEELVHPEEELYFRKVTIHNDSKIKRNIRLYFYQNVYEKNQSGIDTAFFAPKENVMFHYKKDKCWLFNGQFDNKGIGQYTTFTKMSVKPLEEHCLSQRNGHLFFNPIAKGNVTSILSFEANLLPFETKSAYYWIAAGDHKEDAVKLNQKVLDISPKRFIKEIELGKEKSELQPINIADRMENKSVSMSR